MTSLTIVSIRARKAIRYTIYFIILFFIVRSAVKTAIALYRKFFPPAPPPPTVAFGKLPKIPFPIRPVAGEITYKLETPDSSSPKLIEQLPVFVMPAFTPKINAFTDAKQKAEKLGFTGGVQNISDKIPNMYNFVKRGSSTTLTINIVNNTFSISSDLIADTSILLKRPPSPEAATQNIISYLQSAEAYPEDLSGEVKTQLLKVESGQLKEAISLSEANFIRVNFFRKSIVFRNVTLNSVTPNFPRSNVWFDTNGTNIVQGEYHYFPMDESKSATYPLKTAEEAWKELNDGKAYIANLGSNQPGQITIRRIYLSYYDPNQYSPFYQPVIVFEGDNGFYAYVPAITDEYYGKSE